MKYLILLALLVLSSCLTLDLEKDSDRNSILQKIDQQQAAWNSSDLEAFMQAYHQSDSLKFIGRNGVNYGWVNVLNNYRSHYSSPEKMGNLNFRVIHLDRMGKNSFRMIGRYALDFTTEEESQIGYFTLIWEKIKGSWLITSDHTSG